MTKAHAAGGLALDRITSSLVIAAAMVAVVSMTSLRFQSETPPEKT